MSISGIYNLFVIFGRYTVMSTEVLAKAGTPARGDGLADSLLQPCWRCGAPGETAKSNELRIPARVLAESEFSPIEEVSTLDH